MKNWLRATLLLILCLLVAVGSGLWIYKNELSRRGIEWGINRFYPPLGGSLRIGRCDWDPSFRLQLQDLRGSLTQKNGRIDFSCRQLNLLEPIQTTLRSKKLSVKISGVQLSMEGSRAEQLDCLIQDWSWTTRAESPRKIGQMTVGTAQLGQLNVRNLTAEIFELPDGYRFSSLEGDLLGGNLKGSATVHPDAKKNAAIVLDARLTQIGLGELSVLNPEIFRGAAGTADGTLAFAGFPDGNFQMSFHFKSTGPGGEIQAPFFKGILPYLPDVEGVRLLRSDIDLGKAVRFKSALTRLDTTQPGEWKALLMMALPEYTVDLNVDFTIRLGNETAFSQIIQLWKRFKTNNSSS